MFFMNTYFYFYIKIQCGRYTLYSRVSTVYVVYGINIASKISPAKYRQQYIAKQNIARQ